MKNGLFFKNWGVRKIVNNCYFFFVWGGGVGEGGGE